MFLQYVVGKGNVLPFGPFWVSLGGYWRSILTALKGWTNGFDWNIREAISKGCLFISHTIHVWYIYLHWPYFTIKNNQM